MNVSKPKRKVHNWLILSLTLIVTALGSTVGAQSSSKNVKAKKTELSKIRVELDQTEKRLDSLRNNESKLLNKLKDLDERIALDRDVIKKVNAKLGRLRKNKSAAKAKLQASRVLMTSKHDRFQRDIQAFYLSEFDISGTPQGLASQDQVNSLGSSNPLGQIESSPSGFPVWQTTYFSAIGALRLDEVGVSASQAKSAQSNLSSVSKSEREVESLRKKNTARASMRKSERDLSKSKLGKVRKDKETAADRLLNLSEEAKHMNSLVARLEAREREKNTARRSSPEASYTGLFVAQKGRLKPPLQGRIVTGFGWKTDGVTNLKTFSPGVEIQGGQNYNVRAVAEGVIAYIGSLRGYGKFVIIAHDDGFYTTYGGLERIKVVLDQVISVRTAVGVTATGLVKFEIRKGKESVDPISWLDFTQLH